MAVLYSAFFSVAWRNAGVLSETTGKIRSYFPKLSLNLRLQCVVTCMLFFLFFLC